MNLVKINSIDEIKVGDTIYSFSKTYQKETTFKYEIVAKGKTLFIVKLKSVTEKNPDYFYEYLDSSEMCASLESDIGPMWYKEQKRWRAKISEEYFYVGYKFSVEKSVEIGKPSDRIDYELGNYFKTEQQAQEAADEIKKKLDDLHLKFSEEK